MDVIQNKFAQYPPKVQPALSNLRHLIYSLATELELGAVEEALKWGEPSFKVKTGSPIRIDWKASTPDNYYIFFNCQTKLVDTFRELYSDQLVFQGNRAVVFTLNEPLPERTVKHCLTLALTYQKVKHLPLLGT